MNKCNEMNVELLGESYMISLDGEEFVKLSNEWYIIDGDTLIREYKSEEDLNEILEENM
jgi:hypothetical protein